MRSRHQSAEPRTPYHVVLYDGVRTFMLCCGTGSHMEIAESVGGMQRHVIDAVVRAGPRPGVNPRFILRAMHLEVRRRIDEAASRLHARRAFEPAGRGPEDSAAALGLV